MYGRKDAPVAGGGDVTGTNGQFGHRFERANGGCCRQDRHRGQGNEHREQGAGEAVDQKAGHDGFLGSKRDGY
ncbi:hypothetical protein SDC9_146919 [bioreactor metagenome]|uniref:Uncharacterized protein n=1 Tax=bioreactor metagenome TaxID=1076179 RepID=A0A645EE84_9ZZZZ